MITQKNNTLLFAFYNIIANIVLLFSNGAFLQSFLLSFGLSEAKVGILTSLYSTTQLITMIFCCVFSDKIKDLKKLIAYSTLPQSIFYIVMTLFCVFNNVSSVKVYILTFMSIFVQGLSLGIINVLIYKFPYLIIDMNEYGKITAFIGLICGVFSVLNSGIVKLLIKNFSYYYVMFSCFAVCSILLVIQFILVINMKTITPYVSEEKIRFYSIFKHKTFILLAIPNFFRGITLGMLQMIPIFATKQFDADSNMISTLVIVVNIGSILGSFVFLIMQKIMELNHLSFFSSMTIIIPLLIMSLSKNWILYLILYFIANIGLCVFSGVVPVYVSKIVPFQIMGTYTSLRMMLTTGGTALGALICSNLIGKFSIPFIVISMLAFQLICGIVYGLYPILSKISFKR